MSRTTLKILVLIALASLLVYEVAAIVTTVFSHMWGYIVSAIVAGVTFFCTWMASGGKQMKGWYLVPTILFVVIPTAYKAVRIVFFDTTTRFDMWAALAPLLFGFLLPAGILLFIFWRVLREEKKEKAAEEAKASEIIDVKTPAA
jgi:hypothetical protein